MKLLWNLLLFFMVALAASMVVCLAMHTLSDGLPPTKEELNCRIKTPVCRDGEILPKYIHVKISK